MSSGRYYKRSWRPLHVMVDTVCMLWGYDLSLMDGLKDLFLMSMQWKILYTLISNTYTLHSLYIMVWSALEYDICLMDRLRGLIFSGRYYDTLLSSNTWSYMYCYGMICGYHISLMGGLKDWCSTSSGKYYVHCCRPIHVLFNMVWSEDMILVWWMYWGIGV